MIRNALMMKLKTIALLATVSAVSVAAADPVLDFNAAKTAIQSAFDALKAERDAALAALAQCKLAPGCYIAPPPKPTA